MAYLPFTLKPVGQWWQQALVRRWVSPHLRRVDLTCSVSSSNHTQFSEATGQAQMASGPQNFSRSTRMSQRAVVHL